MNYFVAVPLLALFGLAMDVVLLKVLYARSKSIIRTLTITDSPMKFYIIEDLFRNAKVQVVRAVTVGCCEAADSIKTRDRMRILTAFSDVVLSQLTDQGLFDRVLDHEKLSIRDIFSAYIWIHAYLYGKSEREHYASIAFSQLEHFSRSIDERIRAT
jgi:hypothetical protein